MSHRVLGFAIFGLAFATLTPIANATAVIGFDAAYTAAGQWYQSDVRPGGSAAVVSLVGAGGNLESNQPLPSGAARLTTDNTNAAKAEVAVADAYGKAGNILRSLELQYDFYRSNAAGQNTAAAPALKLTFYKSSACIGDCFVTLVYEPYWQSGSSADPTANQWTHASIDFDTGLFWQNGGFGQTNSAGGPPLKTLQDWSLAFNADFAGADLISVGMGVGTFNPGQNDYFDNVQISHSFGTGYSANYDFGPAAPAVVPEPSAIALAGLAILALAGSRRHKAG